MRIRATDRIKHGVRMHRTGGVRGARRGAYLLFVEEEQPRLGVDTCKGKIGGVRKAVGGIAADRDVRHLGEHTAFKMVPECEHVLGVSLQRRGGEFAGLPEADNGRNILRSPALSVLSAPHDAAARGLRKSSEQPVPIIWAEARPGGPKRKAPPPQARRWPLLAPCHSRTTAEVTIRILRGASSGTHAF